MIEIETYESTVQSYTTDLRGLFAVPAGAAEAQAVSRGAGVAAAPEVLASRAETLVATSRRLGEMTGVFLNNENEEVRAAAEMKLLAQMNAELEVAMALLQVAEEGVDSKGAVSRAASNLAGAQRVVNEMVAVLEQPLAAGMAPYYDAETLRGPKPKTREEALKVLQTGVQDGLETICRSARKAGSRAVDVLFSLDATLLKEGVSLVNKEVGELIEGVVKGFNDTMKRLGAAAMKLLLQVYDWALSLLGKDTESTARQKVHEWLEELRTSHQEDNSDDLADRLVKLIYGPDGINKDVGDWLKTSTADLDQLYTTSEKVNTIAANYEAKTAKVETALKVTGFVKALPLPVDKLPYVQLVLAAVITGLLGYTLYSGYDHVDTGTVELFKRFKVSFPDRVEGIRETIQKAVVVV